MNLFILGIGLSVLCVWLPLTVGLLVLRGDLDAEAVPRPLRAIGLILVVPLSHVTALLARGWRRVRSSKGDAV